MQKEARGESYEKLLCWWGLASQRKEEQEQALKHPAVLETWEHAAWPSWLSCVHIDFHEKLRKDLWRVACDADVFNRFTGAVGYFYPAIILESTGRSKLESLSETIKFQEKICGKD